jgi:hypothetical protein
LREGKVIDIRITPVFTERQLYDDSGQPLKDEQGLPITEIRPIIGIQLGAQNTPLSLAEAFDYSGKVVAGTFGFIADLPNQLYQVILATVGVQERNPAGAVSIVGVGMRSHSGVAARMFTVLAAEGVNIGLISTSEIKISVVIDLASGEKAMRALHKAFLE